MEYNKPYYDDFPILDNESYLNLMHAYETKPKDRNVFINLIYTDLEQCKQICLGISPDINKKIRDVICESKKELDKICDNLKSSFSISISVKEVKTFNIFTFVKCLSSALENFSLWEHNEEKQYYKTLANFSTISLINIIKNVMTVLEDKNIKIYKYL